MMQAASFNYEVQTDPVPTQASDFVYLHLFSIFTVGSGQLCIFKDVELLLIQK